MLLQIYYIMNIVLLYIIDSLMFISKLELSAQIWQELSRITSDMLQRILDKGLASNSFLSSIVGVVNVNPAICLNNRGVKQEAIDNYNKGEHFFGRVLIYSRFI